MPTITNAQVFAGLRYAEGFRWSGSSLTYSIPSSTMPFYAPASYEPGSEPFDPAFGVLNAAQRTAFINAIGAWERLIDFDLVEAPDTTLSQGQIRAAFTDTLRQLGDDGAAAYAYTPPAPGSFAEALNGDIWIDDDLKTENGAVGGFFYATMLHELGHALGLKHPFEGTPLPAGFDSTRYTVMSYNQQDIGFFRQFVLEGNTLSATGTPVEAQTPMVLDIIAIQGIYGASSNVELGANTYTFNENAPLLATIVDNGGTDTFDFSVHTRASNINLTPGEFSSVAQFSLQAQIAAATAAFPGFGNFISNFLSQPGLYTWTDNLATSLNTVIENVLGGSGDDTVIGNSAANSLSGGAGSDSIFGGLGTDTVVGGSAGAAGNYLRGDEWNDSLLGGANFDDANGNMGNDTVSTGAGDDYCVGGKDSDLLFGDAGFDIVYGNLGDDSCSGGDGADIIRGGQSNDTLSGGDGNDFVSGDRGDDTMLGGLGADNFHSSMDAGIDRVLDFSVAEGDRVQLDPGTTFTIVQIGGDTVIQMSAAQVILVGVSMSTLPAGTVFGA